MNKTDNFKNITDSNDKTDVHYDQRKLIENIAIREGFSDFNVELIPINTNGGNYLGMLYHAVIRGKKEKQIEELRLFLKVAPVSGEMRDIVDVHVVYCNEIFTYKVLFKLYEEIQNEENIPEEEKFKFPKFYGYKESDHCETLVLENLSYKNYKVLDRFHCVNLDYAKAAIENLAKFHAISYILERRHPSYFEELIKPRKGNVFLDCGRPERIKKHGSKIMYKTLENLKNAEHARKLKNFFDDCVEHIDKYIKVNKHPVLCHGDYRANNLLVKYNKNKEVESMVAIDYQFTHFGSPVNDILYFIFGATDTKFRDLHFDFIIEFYYRTLGDFLKKFSLDVEDIYPKKEFDSDVKSHMMIGLMVASYLLPFFLMSEKEVTNLEEFDSSVMEKDTDNKVFSDRFNGIIEDFVKWGYL